MKKDRTLTIRLTTKLHEQLVGDAEKANEKPSTFAARIVHDELTKRERLRELLLEQFGSLRDDLFNATVLLLRYGGQMNDEAQAVEAAEAIMDESGGEQ